MTFLGTKSYKTVTLRQQKAVTTTTTKTIKTIKLILHISVALNTNCSPACLLHYLLQVKVLLLAVKSRSNYVSVTRMEIILTAYAPNNSYNNNIMLVLNVVQQLPQHCNTLSNKQQLLTAAAIIATGNKQLDTYVCVVVDV